MSDNPVHGHHGLFCQNAPLWRSPRIVRMQPPHATHAARGHLFFLLILNMIIIGDHMQWMTPCVCFPAEIMPDRLLHGNSPSRIAEKGLGAITYLTSAIALKVMLSIC